MRLQLHAPILARAEAESTVAGALRVLRELPLAHFGWFLWSLPDAEFPNLSRLLPAMASWEDQNLWTGEHGYPLLLKSVSFQHVVGEAYHRLTGRSMHGAKVLDYGSGWGRFLRLMAFYTDPEAIQGVDPWDRSIAVCEKDRVWGRNRLSEYLPDTLPVDGPIDLAIAFSVFTHTSEAATRAALAAVRKSMAPGGIFALTFRPVEYWDLARQFEATTPSERMRADHERDGFAFTLHQGFDHYGDTSMSLDWLRSAAEGWNVVEHGCSIEDPYQLVAYLRAV